jgi:Zn-dependent protease with chaperone function
MDFFENQERARRRTSLLVFYFLAAVLLIVVVINVVAAFGVAQARAHAGGTAYSGTLAPFQFDPEVAWWATGLTIAIIGGGTLVRWLSLRSGGRAVAEMVGGRPIDPGSANPAARRLLNIVEEMSIASGVPMPAVYVLEDEAGINAFAAGYSPNDAVVAVTRGCMERLNRDELQGVVAHEFSHILNGDMRLNVRLIAVLFGILMIAMVGRGLLRGLRYARPRGRGKGAGGAILVMLAAGLAMLLIGYVGFFFGRLIQAAVSRQREFLADAAAVQFTRNPGGIGGALKKIGGHPMRGRIVNESATQISHFFFSQAFGRSSWLGLFATHPPILERIRAIEPNFNGEFPAPAPERFQPPPPPSPAPPVLQRADAITAALLLGSIGAPTPAHVIRARQIVAAMPPAIAAAAREPAVAPAAVFALLLSHDANARARQLERVGVSHAGPIHMAATELAPAADALAPEQRLPLVSIALPALRTLPATELAAFLETVRALVREDNEVTLFEFAVLKALERHLIASQAGAGGPRITSFGSVLHEFNVILSTLARLGAETSEQALAAFRVASARVPMLQASLKFLGADACTLDAVGGALTRLASGSPAIRKVLLAAACEAAAVDGTISPGEAELIRAIADSLDCPIPPMLGLAGLGQPPGP